MNSIAASARCRALRGPLESAIWRKNSSHPWAKKNLSIASVRQTSSKSNPGIMSKLKNIFQRSSDIRSPMLSPWIRSIMDFAPRKSQAPIREPNMPENKREKKDEKKKEKDKKPVLKTDSNFVDDLHHENWTVKIPENQENSSKYVMNHIWNVNAMKDQKLETEKAENSKNFTGIIDPTNQQPQKKIENMSLDKNLTISVTNPSDSSDKISIQNPDHQNSEILSNDDYNIPPETPQDGEITAWQEVVERSKLNEEIALRAMDPLANQFQSIFIRPEPPEPKLDVQSINLVAKDQSKTEDNVLDDNVSTNWYSTVATNEDGQYCQIVYSDSKPLDHIPNHKGNNLALMKQFHTSTKSFATDKFHDNHCPKWYSSSTKSPNGDGKDFQFPPDSEDFTRTETDERKQIGVPQDDHRDVPKVAVDFKSVLQDLSQREMEVFLSYNQQTNEETGSHSRLPTSATISTFLPGTSPTSVELVEIRDTKNYSKTEDNVLDDNVSTNWYSTVATNEDGQYCQIVYSNSKPLDHIPNHKGNNLALMKQFHTSTKSFVTEKFHDNHCPKWYSSSTKSPNGDGKDFQFPPDSEDFTRTETDERKQIGVPQDDHRDVPKVAVDFKSVLQDLSQREMEVFLSYNQQTNEETGSHSRLPTSVTISTFPPGTSPTSVELVEIRDTKNHSKTEDNVLDDNVSTNWYSTVATNEDAQYCQIIYSDSKPLDHVPNHKGNNLALMKQFHTSTKSFVTDKFHDNHCPKWYSSSTKSPNGDGKDFQFPPDSEDFTRTETDERKQIGVPQDDHRDVPKVAVDFKSVLQDLSQREMEVFLSYNQQTNEETGSHSRLPTSVTISTFPPGTSRNSADLVEINDTKNVNIGNANNSGLTELEKTILKLNEREDSDDPKYRKDKKGHKDGDYIRIPGDPYPYSREHFEKWRVPHGRCPIVNDDVPKVKPAETSDSQCFYAADNRSPRKPSAITGDQKSEEDSGEGFWSSLGRKGKRKSWGFKRVVDSRAELTNDRVQTIHPDIAPPKRGLVEDSMPKNKTSELVVDPLSIDVKSSGNINADNISDDPASSRQRRPKIFDKLEAERVYELKNYAYTRPVYIKDR